MAERTLHTDTISSAELAEADLALRNLVVQPGDEWKLEQGLRADELPILDQTAEAAALYKKGNTPGLKGSNDDADHPEVHPDVQNIDSDKVFAEEREGWGGYVEWEDYPEKKELAHKIMISHKFPPPPDFQLGPIPDTNPVLSGERWKLWHKAIGGPLTSMPEESWVRVVQEKHKDMLHVLEFPYNGESPKRLTTAQPITPNSLFFVRNHGGIPDIDAEKWDLKIDGLIGKTQTLTLKDIMDETRFPRVKKVCTIQCSGTRRHEQIDAYPGEGDDMINAPWAEGAIGTAEWEGVTLKSVLKYCGGVGINGKGRFENGKMAHCEFHGADTYFKQNNLMNYLVSVPYSKVKAGEVLLAFKMNGKPLPKIHGYPVRALVMGYIGARSVKWLYRVRILDAPSRAPVQSKEYLYFNAQVGKHNQLPINGINIQEMPVSSAIMSPWTKQVVIHNGEMEIKGWAYSGGGRWVERVECSPDGGFTWYMCPVENMSKKYKFGWRTWHMKLPMPAEGWQEVLARAWDNSLNTQPVEVRHAWNWGLHVTQSCHRIKIYSVNKSKPLTADRLQKFEDHGASLGPITRPTEFPTMSEEDYEKYWEHAEPRDIDE